MGDPYCRDKAGDIVCGNCDAGIGDEVEYARREGVIEAAHYARSLATIVHDETAQKVLLDLADTLERGDYRRAEQKEG